MFFSHKENLQNPHQQTHQLPLPLERRARTLYKGMYVVFMYIPCMYLCMYPPIFCVHCVLVVSMYWRYPSLEICKMESNGHFGFSKHLAAVLYRGRFCLITCPSDIWKSSAHLHIPNGRGFQIKPHKANAELVAFNDRVVGQHCVNVTHNIG